MISDSSYRNLLQKFKPLRILVVGDLMLDEYIWGTADRISPEAPVPVVRCQRRTYAPGGAANVVANVAALGATPVVCGVVGDDGPGVTLTEELAELGAEISGVLRDRERCTTLKTRVIAHHQQVVRLDHETLEPITPQTQEELNGFIANELPRVDGVLLSDYNKGVLTASGLASYIKLGRKTNKVVAAGPKPENLRAFTGATLLSFNRSEAHQSVRNLHIPAAEDDSSDTLEEVGRHLIQELACDALTITRGDEGVSLFLSGGDTIRVAGMPVQVFDVAGAGDTFLTCLTLALCAGAHFETATTLANAAAACVVRKVGVVTASTEEIAHLLETHAAEV